MKYLCSCCGNAKSRYWIPGRCRDCWKKSLTKETHWNYGKHWSEEVRLKISKANTGQRMGPLNHKYKEVKSIRRTYRLPWKIWRKNVLQRDFNTCRICFSKINVQVHHIRPYRDDIMNMSLTNGITLCDLCHRTTFGFEHLLEDIFQGTLRNEFNSEELSQETTPSQQEELRKVLWARVTVRTE